MNIHKKKYFIARSNNFAANNLIINIKFIIISFKNLFVIRLLIKSVKFIIIKAQIAIITTAIKAKVHFDQTVKFLFHFLKYFVIFIKVS